MNRVYYFYDNQQEDVVVETTVRVNKLREIDVFYKIKQDYLLLGCEDGILRVVDKKGKYF